jgi:zinc transporter ZupT
MNLCRRGRKQARFAVALTAAMTAVAALGSASFVLASPLRRMAASTVAFSSDGTRFVAWQNRARPASSYKFEDLAITRHVAADGKPLSGFVSYFRLNRALPFAPRRKFEGEEEGGPRLFAAYVSVDRVHDEGSTETMGNDASRHCYTEAIEVHAHEHQPRIGELVNVSLVVQGKSRIMARTRVRTRKLGPIVREPDGTRLVTQSYE